jgi:hypothetical protein
MASPPSLVEAQRWLQQAILAPVAGPDQPVARMLTRSAQLTARQRLDIYRRGYRLRLLEAMRRLYPGLRALLGDELFDDFASDYLDANPSHRPTLARLGDAFVGHLASRRPDRARPPEQREAWVDLLLDLARYERVFTEVYDGPGVENTAPSASAARVGLDASMTAAPCLRTLSLGSPVHRYVAAVRRGERPQPPRPRQVFLVIFRDHYTVTATELAASDYALLRSLLRGVPVRVAAARARVDPARALALARRWHVSRWLVPRSPTEHQKEEP